MEEKQLQAEVHRLLRARPELVWHHCAAAYRCAGQKGFPDLFIAGTRLIARELKGDWTPVRRHQQAYADVLIAAGISCRVWRSEDLESGLIEAELNALLPRSAHALTPRD